MSQRLHRSKQTCTHCSARQALWHERTRLFLCVECIEKYEDDNPDELTER